MLYFNAAMTILTLSFLVLIFGGSVYHPGHQEKEGITIITPTELHARMQEDGSLVVLDVRTPEEYASPTGHLRGAKLIPLQELPYRVGELDSLRSHTVVFYCRSGHRSGVAAELLRAKGFRALNMVGGIIRWNQEKLPVVQENNR